MPAKPIFAVASIVLPSLVLLYVRNALRADRPRAGMASAMAEGLILVFGIALAGLVAVVPAAIALLRGERWAALSVVGLLGGLACWGWLFHTR